MEAISTGLVTSFTSIAGDMTSAIADILPVAIPVMGAIAVIGIGIRVFKKIAK